MTPENQGPQEFAIGTPPVPTNPPQIVVTHRGEGSVFSSPDRRMEEGRTQGVRSEVPQLPVFTWADTAAWGRENLPNEPVPQRRRREEEGQGGAEVPDEGQGVRLRWPVGRPMPYSCGFQESLYAARNPSATPPVAAGEASRSVPPEGNADGRGGGEAVNNAGVGQGLQSDSLVAMLMGQQRQTLQIQQTMERLVNRMDAWERQQVLPGVPPALNPLQQQPPGLPVYTPYGGAQVPPPPPPLASQADAVTAAGRNLDPKWIPSMPSPPWQSWKSRQEEVAGFWSWVEAFSGWLSLVHSSFPAEIREVLQRQDRLLETQLDDAQRQRAQRLFYLLQQSFSGFLHRVRNLLRVYELEVGVGATNGYEVLRRLKVEFSVQTRSEAIQCRNEVLNFRVKHHDGLPDLLRQIDAKLFTFRQLIATFPDPASIRDLDVLDSDLYLVLLRNLPTDVRQYAQLHGGETVDQIKRAVMLYHNRTKVVGDLGKLNTMPDIVRADKGAGKGQEDPKGKGKGKDKDGKGGKKGQPSRSPSRSASDREWSEKCRKEGLCFKCGKTGHESKSCPNAGPGPGKGKNEERKKMKCTKCGLRGHLAETCRRKPKKTDKLHAADSGADGASEAEPESEGERIVMTMFSHVERLGPGQSKTVHEIHEVSESVAFVDSKAPGAEWLIDSGATSHIVSKDFLSWYRVVQEHRSKCELRAANGDLIEASGMVDLEVPFLSKTGAKNVKRKFVLSRCIVAAIPFSVISPFVLAKNGWGTLLEMKSETCLFKSGIKIFLSLKERAWWAISLAKGPERSSDRNGPQPMDVSSLNSDVLKTNRHEVSSIVERESPAVIGDSGKPPGILKRDLSKPPAGGSPVVPPQSVSKSIGALSFLIREFSSESFHVEASCVSETCVCESCCEEKFVVYEPNTNETQSGPQSSTVCERFMMLTQLPCVETVGEEVVGCDVPNPPVLEDVLAGDDDMEDIPLPGLDEPIDDDDDRVGEEHELELGPQGWYEHLSKGHQPYLSTCLSCVRSQGKIPAKRLRLGSRSRSVVNCDFGFRGGVKFLVMVVAATGMLLGRVMSPIDSGVNARAVNQMFKELGLTGHQVELVSDGDDTLIYVFVSHCVKTR